MSNETFTAGGSALRRHQTALSAIADEYVFEFTDRGIITQKMDPANVAGVRTVLDPGVTGEYDSDDFPDEVGVNNRLYRRAVSPANKGNGDTPGDMVEFGYNSDFRRLSATVEKEVEGMPVTHETTWSAVDPDSIRRFSDYPELDHEAAARMPKDTFLAVANKTLGGGTDHVSLSEDGGDLVFEAESDRSTETSKVEGAIDTGKSVGSSALFSADYLRSVKNTVRDTKPEKVSVAFAEGYPCEFNFEFPAYGLEVQYIVAPRIKSS